MRVPDGIAEQRLARTVVTGVVVTPVALALIGTVLLAGQAAANTTRTILHDPEGETVEFVPLVGFDFVSSGQAVDGSGQDGADGVDCTKDHNGDTTEGEHGSSPLAPAGEYGPEVTANTGAVSGSHAGSFYAVLANGGSGGDGGSNMVANQGSSYQVPPGVERGSQCEQGSKRGRDAGDAAEAGVAELIVGSGDITIGSTALIVQSLGGDGGDGGSSYKNKDKYYSESGDGGRAAMGSIARVENSANLNVQGETGIWTEYTYVVDDSGIWTGEYSINEITVNNAHGIVAQSGGGVGGEGGENPTKNGRPGGDGGVAASGGKVEVQNRGNITTTGGSGIVAQNVGGFGGDAGINKKGKGGAGGDGGDGGSYRHDYGVRVSNSGDLALGCGLGEAGACDILNAFGIYAQSVGGGGGNSGGAGGSTAIGADGGAAGYGYRTLVDNSGDIAVHTQGSIGIFAQSIGGGGGSGGMAHAKGSNALAIGGSGGDGGAGGVVKVENSGDLCTGGACGVSLSELTENTQAVGGAAGIVAQSVGGGGGHGGSAKAKSTGSFWGLVGGKAVAIGGAGGAGGAGLGVTVANTGSIITAEGSAPGILAQSVGGGGGNGAGAVAFDLSLLGAGEAVSVGGAGGGGGDGSRVSVNCAGYSDVAADARACEDTAWSVTTPTQTLQQTYSPDWLSNNDNNEHVIATAGLASSAIAAQSVGGGGGSGGYAVAVAGSAAGVVPTVAFAQGGSGGSGGDGGALYAGSNGTRLYTLGDVAAGILAQSIGGGGGAGGYAVSLADSAVGAPVALSMGGSGEVGGHGDQVVVDNPGGLITTAGDLSHGILAQSIGGGGGSGGAVSSATDALLGISTSVALGGSGSAGGDGDRVGVYNRNGAALGIADVGNADIATQGYGANAILAQSIGGGGAAGGASMAGSAVLANSGAASLAVGGSGAGGGRGAAVDVENWGNLTTLGDNAVGMAAQSVGGGGGIGGNAVSVSGTVTGAALSMALGGRGGAGGAGDQITLENNGGDLATAGAFSHGILAQSIGGGGGNGGMAVSGSAALVGITASAAVGGQGGAGGTGGAVVVANQSGAALGNAGAGNASILTQGYGANAILAQSLGGDGGAGGFSAAGSATLAGVNAALSIGGGGASGGTAGLVTALNSGQLVTQGGGAAALVAQSIGGSGGMGGFSATASGDLLGEPLALSLGGEGGNGGQAGAVSVNNSGVISTQGDGGDVAAHGILAQSIGGNGGAGGVSLAATGSLSGTAEVALSLGGAGSGGGRADMVMVNNTGESISTRGEYAQGILAQSIGGNGGAGGMALSAAASVTSRSAAVALGGGGNSGGESAAVMVSSSGDIATSGYGASALAAQSIAGFGGAGGVSAAASATFSNAGAVAVGGGAGTGAKAGNVQVDNSANLTTLGGGAAALLAQSLGGDGGLGGFAASASVSFDSNGSLALGGGGARGGTAGSVRVDNQGDITVVAEGTEAVAIPTVPNDSVNQALEAWALVSGDEEELPDEVADLHGLITGQANPRLSALQANAPGILAQSLGGGGGAGGFAAAAGVVAGGNNFDVGVGGDGGGGGTGGGALVNNSGSVVTQGTQSPGIAAMSLGGQGGMGGFAASVGADGWNLGTASTAVGGDGGSGGDAGAVTLTTANDSQAMPVMTQGTQSPALLAMSVGGNGGAGGFDAAVSLSGLGGASVGVGGDGGDGGTGAAVSVDSSQYLSTSGLLSPGVLATSIGGHGGMGGFSASLAESLVKSLAASVGGNGGAGGRSGPVDVGLDAPVVTYGNVSSGVIGQSIGGSGGMGGAAVSSVVTMDVVPNKPLELNVGGAAGGAGGGGGLAGNVQVDSDDLIQTYGFLSHALVAQSVGGSGGLGGLAVDGSFDLTLNQPAKGADDTNVSFALAVGGEGGVGGDAGAVQVDQGGNLVTGYGVVENGEVGAAFLSSGILAQSIGGSGGMGGAATSIAAGTNASSAALAVGGLGGVGGDAGAVTVNSNVDCASTEDCGDGITTFGAGSAAIKAQSIGGGGGSGGAAIGAASVGMLPSVVGVGGAGGDGGAAGHGGEVDVTAGGSLTTFGVNSAGVLAQSVGGGGGDGGASLSGNYQAGTLLQKTLSLFGVDMDAGGEDDDVVRSSASTVSDAYQSWAGAELPSSSAASASMAVGGDGGAGGDGEAVEVNSTARIVTGAGGQGHQSAGILAQSVGGGGGHGGFASVGQDGAVTGSVLLGGSGGIGGQGRAVTVTASNLVMTTGAQSPAIAAQSIGGGGGTGGQTFDGSNALGAFSLGLGADGGAGGAGGEVNVDNRATLITNGAHSGGIVAQSVGGGGGNASGGLLGGVGDYLPAAVTAAATARTGAVSLDDLLDSGAQVGLLDGGRAGQAGADAGAAFAIGIGGAGGGGGNAGQVEVINSGNIFTGAEVDENDQIVASGTPLRTAHSASILAQSVGGGGGAGNASSVDANAGKSSVAAAVGGTGDGSESVHRADAVTVRNTGSLVTYGVNSAGIHAQSVGGGGGASGTFNGLSGALEGLSGAAAHALQVGGTMRGNGAMVKVCDKLNDNGACQTSDQGQTILTHGAGSHGILAQSIGGGGGSAVAFGSALTETIADEVASGDFDLSVDGGTIAAAASRGVVVGANLGGTAGSGGDRYGERVRVFTAADVSTEGTGAMGVLAQSVGGGGGLAASHVLNASSGDHRLETALGADMSGPNARGGNATVELRGDVLTEGDLAHGVVAQTVGGGGVLQASSHTAASEGLNAMDIALGAQGGANNAVNNRTDALSATLTRAVRTLGHGAVGVLAQSVGAGGGLVAGHTASASNGDVQAGLRLGSEGVNGAGGAVMLSYGKSVRTEGANAVGLLAQSVGGGGGLVLVGHDSRVDAGEINVDMELGYRHVNEEGGSGGAVTVDNGVGTVVTRGDNASGLVMQSVAGGGTSLFASSAVAPDSDVNANFQLGGVGSGGGGQGVTATLGTTGQASSIVTEGRNAFGLVAQSIGGGGGLASFSLAARDDDVATDGQLTEQAYLGMADRMVTSGHYGGLVDLDLADVAIQTEGLNSAGLVAQSIGGGGGIAAGVAGADSLFDGGMRLGVSGGADSGSGDSGAGGGVTLNLLASRVGGETPTSLISTAAPLTPALLAQSIGGGGGYSAMQASDLTLGGNAGSQAADVTVNNSATLVTTGTGAIGLVAQSIGGGGGLGYASGKASLGGAPSGANGKAVTVRQDGDLSTYGDHAHGILAQSVGGGGGTVLSKGGTVNATVDSGTGHAGNVNVYVNGNVTTYGKGAHGVVAQSAAGGGGLVQDGDELRALYGGGGGKPGQVTVTVNGGINVSGEGAHAIYATASDDPLVEIGEGASVVGGPGGSAVYFEADRNELRNRGFLATADGAEGLVIHSPDGDTRLYNEAGGTLFGAVRLHQDGANLLHNALGGTVLAGADMDLGDGGLLRNEGELGLASEAIGTTTVVGDLIQGESGALALRFDQRDGTADRIQVTGDAQLEGVIAPRLVNAGYIRPGTRQARVFTAEGDLDISGLAALDRALLSHALSVDDEGLEVTTTADFTPAGLDADGRRLGDALGNLQSAGGTRLSRRITEVLAQLLDVQALNDAYETVGSGGVAAVPMMSLQNAGLVMDTVTSRLDGWRTDQPGGSRVQTLTPDGQDDTAARAWLSVAGNTRRGHDLISDVHATMVGVDRALGERSLIGGALTGSRLSFDLDQPDARASGDEYGLNLYGLRRFGNAYGSAMLFAASNRVDYKSYLHGRLGTLSGETEFNNRVFGTRVEGGYDFDLLARRLTLTPFVAVQPTRVEQDDAREVYNENLGPGVDFRATTIESLPMDLGVQAGTHWTLGNGTRLKSFARLAWRHDFETERAVQRDFSEARLRDSSLPVARDSAHARIGLSYGMGRRFSLTGGMEGQWSREYDTFGGSLGVMYRW